MLTFLLTLAPLSAQHQTGSDFFWNGPERVDLSIDASWLAVQFETSVTEAEARALAASFPGVDAGRVAESFYFPGHPMRLYAGPEATEAEVLSAVEAIDDHPRVVVASPRWMAGEEPYFLTDEILVRWQADAEPERVADLERAHRLERSGSLAYAHNPGVVYRVPRGSSLAILPTARALFESGLAEFAQPDFSLVRVAYGTPSDPLFSSQWHLHNTGQGGAKVDADVDAPEAWDLVTGNPALVAAIVDTGIELGHPDLTIVQGIDVLDNDNDPGPDDGLFSTENHGTSVGGVCAGQGNNGEGITGIAQNGGVMPIRFLSDTFFGIFGGPTVQDEVDAFTFASNQGAAVCNNSWGPLGAAPLAAATKAAIDDATDNGRDGLGVVIFFAAGNGDNDVGTNGYASYERTVAVAASTDQDLRASYSAFGDEIDVCAPSNGGVTSGIWTTDRTGGAGYASGDYTGGFGGTSSASPLACGTALLVLDANPFLAWHEVRDVLRASADKIDPVGGGYGVDGHSDLYGHGRVNAHAAVVLALSLPPSGTAVYGVGTAGSGGLAPSISASGVPAVGDASFGVTFADGLAGAPFFLVVGTSSAALPVFGGTLLVDPGTWLAVESTTADAGGAGGVNLPLPGNAGLVGALFYAQWAGLDAGGPQGVSMSPGLSIELQE